MVERAAFVVSSPPAPVLERLVHRRPARRSERTYVLAHGSSACQAVRCGAVMAPMTMSTRLSTKRSSGSTSCSPPLVEPARPVGGGASDEDDADLPARPPQVAWHGRAPFAEQVPRRVAGRLREQLPDLGRGAVEGARQLGADLQVGALPPPALGELGDGSHHGLGRGTDVAGRPGQGLLEELGAAGRRWPARGGRGRCAGSRRGCRSGSAPPRRCAGGRPGRSRRSRRCRCPLGEEPGGGIEQPLARCRLFDHRANVAACAPAIRPCPVRPRGGPRRRLSPRCEEPR